jgi:hypothetical protein
MSPQYQQEWPLSVGAPIQLRSRPDAPIATVSLQKGRLNTLWEFSTIRTPTPSGTRRDTTSRDAIQNVDSPANEGASAGSSTRSKTVPVGAGSWIDRARAKKRPELLQKWWGNPDYDAFFRLGGLQRALAMAKRFEVELGYQFANPWSIHERGNDGRIMYYMIHASDHHRAPGLMSEAHNAASRSGFNAMTQTEMFAKAVQNDDKR